MYPTHCNLSSVCHPGSLEQAASEKLAVAAWLTIALGDFKAYQYLLKGNKKLGDGGLGPGEECSP